MKTILIALFCLFSIISAQVHISYIKPKSSSAALSKNIKKIILPQVNVPKMLEEEKKEVGLAPRYGFAHKRSESLLSGKFEKVEGGRVWRLSYYSKGALFTAIAFDKFYLPPGATLHVLPTKKDEKIMGAYTQANNKGDGTFAIAPIHGEEFTLEIFEPTLVRDQTKLRVKTVTHGYKDLFNRGNAKNGRSGTCNINVVCPESNGWENEIRAVGLLLQASGFRFCTGSMVNNLNNDGKQYFLTAAHCGATPSTWVVLFNYQSATCARGGPTNTDNTVSGMDTIAFGRTSDFHLTQLREEIPAAYNVYLNGFSASDDAEQGLSVGIHHPSGDSKKIAFCRTPLTHSRWGAGPANTHWRVNRWAEGTTEPGSSGSPLYDSKRRVIGQLHGGTASCRNPSGWDVYGKIAFSWNGSSSNQRLKDHLDPKNTGALVSEGANLNDVRK